MADEYHYDKMRQGAEDLRRVTTKIDDLTNDLEARSLRSLASWESEAQEQYKESKQQWDAACQEMRNILHMGAGTVDNVTNRTEHTDKNNRKRFMK